MLQEALDESLNALYHQAPVLCNNIDEKMEKDV